MSLDRNGRRGPPRPNPQEAERQRQREAARRLVPSAEFLRRENATDALRQALVDYIETHALQVMPGCTEPACACGGFGPVATLSLLEEVADAARRRAGVLPSLLEDAPNPERAAQMLRVQQLGRVRARVPSVAAFAARLAALDEAAWQVVLGRTRGLVEFPAWPDTVGEMDEALAVLTDGRPLRDADPMADGLPAAAERVVQAEAEPQDARALLEDAARAAASAILLDGIAAPDACADAYEPFAPVIGWAEASGTGTMLAGPAQQN